MTYNIIEQISFLLFCFPLDFIYLPVKLLSSFPVIMENGAKGDTLGSFRMGNIKGFFNTHTSVSNSALKGLPL
jgi:hypothetical protein